MRAVADNYPNSKTISNTTPINSGAKVTMTTDLPMIYLITPTVYRTEQKADLTRLSHTLRLVPRIHWIVVEDRSKRSRLIANFLANCKVPHTHLAVRTSVPSKLEAKRYGKLVPGWMIPKGVEQRNLGLDWITNNGEYPSVFYLLDDDNTYDLRLFEEVQIILVLINPFPNQPWFLRICSTGFFKTQGEQEKLLVTSNFSFSHSVFYPFEELFTNFIKVNIVVCNLFQFGRV